MHPADIKAAIQKAGSNQVLIAQRVAKPGARHVHKAAVSRVISGNLISQHIAKVVAEVTKIPVSQLWPGKYPQLEFLEATGLLKKHSAKPEPQLAPVTKPRRASRQTTTRRKA